MTDVPRRIFGSMKTVPCSRNRHSIRLKGYDYSRPGAYFVTIVVQDRARMFGYVNGGTIKLNRAGEIVHAAFLSMDEWYPGVRVDAFQVMPDHVHAIVCLSRRPTT
ncbi:MAG: hypothetical protein ABI229_08505, partial [Gemmatimonadaceae bacterium]